MPPSTPEVLPSDHILRSLRRISRALALENQIVARQHGLTIVQFICLRQLAMNANAVSAGTIAAQISVSPQTITGLLDRLVAKKLVKRIRSKHDRRQVLISPTREGMQLVASATPRLQDRFLAQWAQLHKDQQKLIQQALDTVVDLLGADQLDAAPLLAPGHSLMPGSPAEPELPTVEQANLSPSRIGEPLADTDPQESRI